jgi:hypothetical protein
MTNELEKQIINIVATDRLYVPSSSFDGKLERSRKKIGKSLDLSEDFYQGDRAYARIETLNKHRSKDLRAGVKQFCDEHPQYGKILNGMIETERVKKERHLYFGMNDGKRVTNEDYMSVLENMGLGPVTAGKYLDVALDISRTLNRKRDDERSILIG